MLMINQRRMCDAKIQQLRNGHTAYAESSELIRLIERDIKKHQLHVHCEHTNIGCWFTPLRTEEINSSLL